MLVQGYLPPKHRLPVGQAVSLPEPEMTYALVRQADSLPHGEASDLTLGLPLLEMFQRSRKSVTHFHQRQSLRRRSVSVEGPG